MRGTQEADIINRDDETLSYISHVCIPTSTTIVMDEKTRVESYQNIEDWRKRNWGIIDLTMEKIMNLWQHLSNNKVSAACDGSVNGHKAAHAWCLFERTSGNIILQVQAPVDGITDNMISTRAEMMSILAVTSFLDWYHQTYFNITTPITIHTDSENSILLSQKRGLHSTKYALHNDIDCVLEMQRYIAKHKFSIKTIPKHLRL